MGTKRRRHSPDQIIRKLAEGHRLLADGQGLDEVCRHLQVAESTWHRWLAQYGGMKANDAKRLKQLEAENARLKKLVANRALDIDMLRELAEGNVWPRTVVAAPSWCCVIGSGSSSAGRVGWLANTAPPNGSCHRWSTGRSEACANS